MNAPHGRLLLDTSVYIRYIRDGGMLWAANDGAIVERCVLTAVVAAELYAGARDAEEKEHLDALCRWHQAIKTFSHPDEGSWIDAGILLGRYGRVYGSLRMADHFRDVLIALEAVKNHATLMTENTRDFLRWQKLLRAAGTHLRVFDLAKLPE